MNAEDTKDADVKLVAFYLPQFHPFPENDEWWGKGFTEWRNVTKAQPLFIGHYQPHLPADLGFYDLRVPEVRREQIALAKAYGIDAFCYHFYWFSGKRLMERPLDDMLADKASDMPFCLCWANESWTRRWDGRDDRVLIAQKYGPDDPLASIRAMEPYLRDPRYLTHDGKKPIVVYRPQHLPDAPVWMEQWRDYARQSGIGELLLINALTHGNWSYRKYGFDAGVEFPPHNIEKSISYLMPELGFHDKFRGIVPDYKDVAETYLNRDPGDEPEIFRGVYPSWDNTARRKDRALVTLNATPENYEYWLARAISATRTARNGNDGLVFINAWNEWAEGCHLEPDLEHGHAFLEATLRAKTGSRLTNWAASGLPTAAGPAAQRRALERQGRLVTNRAKGDSISRRLAHGIRDALRVVRGKGGRSG